MTVHDTEQVMSSYYNRKKNATELRIHGWRQSVAYRVLVFSVKLQKAKHPRYTIFLCIVTFDYCCMPRFDFHFEIDSLSKTKKHLETSATGRKLTFVQHHIRLTVRDRVDDRSIRSKIQNIEIDLAHKTVFFIWWHHDCFGHHILIYYFSIYVYCSVYSLFSLLFLFHLTLGQLKWKKIYEKFEEGKVK